MNLQELSYFTHVKYYLDKKEKAQIKIRRWYHYMSSNKTKHIHVYTGRYALTHQHRYIFNENGVFFKSKVDATELIIGPTREYALRLIFASIACYFIKKDTYDDILLVI
jgi:hypothetical protein